MGPYVIASLSAAGHEVTVFHRGQTKSELPQGVEELLGDRDRLLDYVDVLRTFSPDVVLDMMMMNEGHARDLLATFAGYAGRVVMASSVDVYQAFGRVNKREDGKVDPALITEDAPLRQRLYPYRGETARTEDDPARWMDDYDKIPAERVVMSHPELPGTVLRLPAVYGLNDHVHRMFRYLKRMLDGRETILLEEGEANWRWTHGYVENVADALALAVTEKQASGRIYNVGEPWAWSIAERVERIAHAVNWHGRIVVVPKERVPEKLLWGIDTAQDIVVDSKRIRQELGYSERIDQHEALRRTVVWERDHFPEKIDPEMFHYAAEDEVLAEAMKEPAPFAE